MGAPNSFPEGHRLGPGTPAAQGLLKMQVIGSSWGWGQDICAADHPSRRFYHLGPGVLVQLGWRSPEVSPRGPRGFEDEGSGNEGA